MTYSALKHRSFQYVRNIIKVIFDYDKKWDFSIVQDWDQLVNGRHEWSVSTLQKQHWLTSQAPFLLAGDLSLFGWPTESLQAS